MDPETREWLQRLFTAWNFLSCPFVEAIALISILVPQRPAVPAAMPAAEPAAMPAADDSADEGPEELDHAVWPDTDDGF